MKWHLVIGGAKEGPFSLAEVSAKIKSGEVKGTALAWKSGMSDWKPLSEACPEALDPSLAKQKEEAPPPAPPSEQVPEKSQTSSSQGLAATAKMFANRFFKSDFQKQALTTQENVQLQAAIPPIHAKDAGNYLAWRRALLWIAGICIGVATLFSLIALGNFGEDAPGILWFVTLMQIAAQAGGCVLAILAATSWTKVERTRKLARLSWACMFFVPFAVALIPLTVFISSKEFKGDDKNMLSLLLAAKYLIDLLPVVFGLFPGLIRSSLSLKTLLPEATMPGWITLVIAPIYALFFLVGMVVSMQLLSLMEFNAFIAFVGFTGLFIAPLMLVFHAKDINSPADAKDLDSTLGRVRSKMKTPGLIGMGAFVVLVLNLDMDISFEGFIRFAANLIANVLLVTVAFSDILLGLFKTAFDREEALREGPLAKSLANRFKELDELGLTDLQAGEMNLVSGMRGKG
tara:strand:- start:4460 stop:5836 length:1377 start_codon:yes stop_codon:yes gene_type:complete